MKPDEYKRARSLICKSFGIDYCEYCPLYDVDNCYEQTDEAEKILLKLLAYARRGTRKLKKRNAAQTPQNRL